MNIIETHDLEKHYGKTKALDKVSISLEKGIVLGLLGPNGAGKTTFVRIIATQLLASGGSAQVLGHDVLKEPQFIRQRIAVVPQEARPLSLQTPYEHILTYLITRGLDVREARERANEAISSFKLSEYRNTICSNLSGGLRQRVLIAMAMSTEAELLVLDEPTIGLDPVARVEVWKLIRDYISKGRTILLTTHYMEEADEISDKLAIVNKGKVVATGTPKEVKARLNATHAVVVRSSNAIPELQKFGRVLRTGTNIRVITSQKGAEDLTSFCLRRNLDVSVRQVTLEDVFISEVGEFDSDAA